MKTSKVNSMWLVFLKVRYLLDTLLRNAKCLVTYVIICQLEDRIWVFQMFQDVSVMAYAHILTMLPEIWPTSKKFKLF